ncbi:MAG TPA: hypothetical protein PLU30_14210 [Verrucomicrobiae bacterium]|nr:hypothetical protein [Verrucomicrobiae bacterium]
MDGANEKGVLAGLLRVPLLTRRRIALAFVVAAAADGITLALGPLAAVPVEEVVDVVAMVLLWRLLGFHFLLLPAFVAEAVPGVEMFPTWLAVVAYLVRLRSKEQRVESGGAAGEPPAEV